MIKIYHNPRCQKSREALAIVESKKSDVQIVEYLKTPPTEEELQTVLKMLGMKPEEIVRKGETLYKEKYKGKDFTDAQWLKILIKNPVLIERPIVVNGKKAVIGRPPENVKKIPFFKGFMKLAYAAA
jgi:arsenate reductase (glutaredoxin)